MVRLTYLYNGVSVVEFQEARVLNPYTSVYKIQEINQKAITIYDANAVNETLKDYVKIKKGCNVGRGL